MTRCILAFIDAATNTSLSGSCSHILPRIPLAFNAVPSVQLKATRIYWWFLVLPLTCRGFCKFSELFDDITDCWWWNPQIACNYEMRNIVLQLLDYLPSYHNVAGCPHVGEGRKAFWPPFSNQAFLQAIHNFPVFPCLSANWWTYPAFILKNILILH